MSKKLNHHFVPQYHLRLFSGGKRYIYLHSLRKGVIARPAGIKDQCARHKFYGDEATEDVLGRLEAKHAAAIHHLVKFASGAGERPSSVDDYAIREAVLLQRHRTPRAATHSVANLQAMRLSIFRHFVESIPKPHLRAHGRRALAAGRVGFEDPTMAALLQSLNLAVTGVPLIEDLRMVILRNRTDIPFILSDSPAVATNLFSWEYPKRGALGHNSRGLMLLLPLSPTLQLVLCDPHVYWFNWSKEPFVDLSSTSDVTKLNTLQLHAAEENVYFADNASSDYVQQLHAEVAPRLSPLPIGFIEHPKGSMLMNGEPCDGELIQSFEPQIPYRIRLSVMKHGSAPCESAVTCGRHAKNSDIRKACKAAVGPFPDIELPGKIVWKKQQPRVR